MDNDKLEYYMSLIDAYIDGDSDHLAEAEIQKGIAEYPFLKKVLAQHTEARANIRLIGEANLKTKLIQEFEPIVETKTKRPLLKYLLLFLLLLSGAAAAYFLLQKNETQESLPLLAVIEDPSFANMRSNNVEAISEKWNKAIQLFSQKDYSNTLKLLDEIELDKAFLAQNSGKIHLMHGVSALQLRQYETALNTLSLARSENPYNDQIQWFQAITLFKKGDKMAAKKSFLIISQDKDHYKSSEASKLLEGF